MTPTTQAARALVQARNSAYTAATRLVSLINDMPVDSLQAELSKADALTNTIADVAATDSEFCAMETLAEAAAHLLAVAQTAGPVVTAPSNWRAEMPEVDAALREMGA